MTTATMNGGNAKPQVQKYKTQIKHHNQQQSCYIKVVQNVTHVIARHAQ